MGRVTTRPGSFFGLARVVSSSSAGLVRLVNASRRPSGDQAGAEAPPFSRVSCVGSPPVIGSRWIWVGLSSVARTNASVRPSGDHRGCPSRWPAVSGFHEVRFPDRIAVGATGGPAFSTTVIATASGYEQRNVSWAEARGRWNVATGLRRHEDVAELIAFFRCRMGRAYGFRFKDHTDFKATAQQLGVGDGTATQFQLVKRYASGPATVTRTVRKPVAGTLALFADATPLSTGVSLDATTGVVTVTPAPALGVILTADVAFDVPVRFDVDEQQLVAATRVHHDWPAIPIVELRL